MELLINIAEIMLFIILGFLIYFKLKVASIGLTMSEFLDFVKANDILENLDEKSKKYEKFNYNEKINFLMESEKVFDIFDKVPNVLWEDLYPKYINVLNTYRDIKMLRWAETNS